MWICTPFTVVLWFEIKHFAHPLNREFVLVRRHEREPFQTLDEMMLMAFFRDVTLHPHVRQLLPQLGMFRLVRSHLGTAVPQKATGAITLRFTAPALSQLRGNTQFLSHIPDISSGSFKFQCLQLKDHVVSFSLLCHDLMSILAPSLYSLSGILRRSSVGSTYVAIV